VDLTSSTVAAALRFPVLVVSLAFHEFAHAWTAHRLGDDTAKNLGRLTLNPLAHLDPVGTLFILFAPFGWGRPVPFDPRYFRAPVRDAGRVAFAGPLTNLALSALAMLAFILIFGAVPSTSIEKVFDFVPPGSLPTQVFAVVLRNFVMINLSLAVFNLLPMPPLDGSHLLRGLLPDSLGRALHHCATSGLGMGLFLLLLVTKVIDYAFIPVAVLLLVLFIGGIVPVAVWAGAVTATTGLFFLTMPAERGAPRRSFFATRPARLRHMQATMTPAVATVLRHVPADEEIWQPVLLSVPVGATTTEHRLYVGEGRSEFPVGSSVEVLLQTDDEGRLEQLAVPSTFDDDDGMRWFVAAVMALVGLVGVVGAFVIWPWRGLFVPDEPRPPEPPEPTLALVPAPAAAVDELRTPQEVPREHPSPTDE